MARTENNDLETKLLIEVSRLLSERQDVLTQCNVEPHGPVLTVINDTKDSYSSEIELSFSTSDDPCFDCLDTLVYLHGKPCATLDQFLSWFQHNLDEVLKHASSLGNKH